MNKHNEFIQIFSPAIQTDKGVLSDLTLAVKDNLMLKDTVTTAGSKILENHISEYTATAVSRLLEKGIKIVGKTNLDEFAMGSSTENSAFASVKNPWDITKVPGGSSGGSAVAVAVNAVDVALGSDTGGSIRQPAAFCGVTGFKPTYGSVSRYGLIAMASSLDVIGVFARSAQTVEQVFSVISGKDEFDQTTIDYQYSSKQIDWSRLRVGLPDELWKLSIDKQIYQKVEEFVSWLKNKGAQIDKVSLPSIPYALPAYYIIMPAEVMANLERFDGIRYQKSIQGKNLLETYEKTRSLGFGPEVKRRILLGTFVLSVGHYESYYQKAVNLRDQITSEFNQTFGNYDILVSATTPTLPFSFGEKSQDPIAMYQSDLLTVSANLAGVPAISIPVGFSDNQLPIGAQLTASRGSDNLLLALAKAYQEETNYHLKKPKGTDG